MWKFCAADMFVRNMIAITRQNHNIETKHGLRRSTVDRKLRLIVEYDADRSHVDIVRRKPNLPLVMTLCAERKGNI